jgi:Group XII secretory phospholipase A2 precursor (PLA2G12)
LLDADDQMTGVMTTNSVGSVSLTFTSKSPAWYNPCTAWDCPGYTNPDIYCVITKQGFYEVYTDTKEDWNQNNVADFGTVLIYPKRTTPVGEANGCGAASFWPGINQIANFLTGFEDQCNNHDYCYSTCSETKIDCDLEFRDMMYSKCNKSWDTSDKSLCKSVASQMFDLVRTSTGDDAYAASRKNC